MLQFRQFNYLKSSTLNSKNDLIDVTLRTSKSDYNLILINLDSILKDTNLEVDSLKYDFIDDSHAKYFGLEISFFDTYYCNTIELKVNLELNDVTKKYIKETFKL